MSKINKKKFAMPYLGVFPDQIKKSYLLKTNQTMHAAGGLVSTSEDIAKFLAFYINTGKVNKKQLYNTVLINNSYNQRVETPDEKPHVFDQKQYAIGWHIGKFFDKEVIYHFGGYAGYFSHISFLPNEKIGVVVLVNHSHSNSLGNLIAQYAYDLYLNGTVDEAKYDQEINNLIEKRKKQQEKQLEQEKNLANRPWKLSLAQTEYTGTFKNEDLGTMTVKLEDKNLVFRLGNLMAVATAYTEPDCFRLEFAPYSGEVICVKPENGKIEVITYNGKKFTRVK